MNKIDLSNYIKEQKLKIDEMLFEHVLSLKLIPNPLYLKLPNQREAKWSELDTEVYNQLNEIREYFEKQLNK